MSGAGIHHIEEKGKRKFLSKYIESFNGKMRDELLNGELLDTLDEAKVLVEAWRKIYNRLRPHSSLGYRPPAPEAQAVGTFTLGLVQC